MTSELILLNTATLSFDNLEELPKEDLTEGRIYLESFKSFDDNSIDNESVDELHDFVLVENTAEPQELRRTLKSSLFKFLGF